MMGLELRIYNFSGVASFIFAKLNSSIAAMARKDKVVFLFS
jgi:hypothetical protein